MIIKTSPVDFLKRKTWNPILYIKLLLNNFRAKHSYQPNKEITILMSDLKDIYTEAEITRDKRLVASVQERFSNWDPLDYAHRAELFFFDGFLNDEWLGSNLLASLPTAYDDYKNKVDIILTINHTVFAIDITTARTPGAIFRKLPRNNIELGFTKLKYYGDGVHFSGRRIVPYFIVGISSSLLKEAYKELRITNGSVRSKSLRIDDFSSLKPETKKAIVSQVLSEIILQAQYYQRNSKNKTLKIRLRALEKYFWPIFLNNLSEKHIMKKPGQPDTYQAIISTFL